MEEIKEPIQIKGGQNMKTLNNKAAILLAASLLFPTGVWAEEAVPELTMEQIVEANMSANLLKNYDSYQVSLSSSSMEFSIYADAEIFYSATDTAEYLNCSNSEYTNLFDGEYVKYMYVGLEVLPLPEQENSVMSVESTLKEEIQEIKKDGEKLIVTTKLSADDYAEIAKASELEFEEGDYSTVEYTLDAETYALLNATEKVIHKDGSEGEVLKSEVTYNAEKPENVQALYNRAYPTENFRTLTIITNPGTDQEKEYKEIVTKGDPLAVYLPDETWKLYTDPACTQEKAENIDKNKDALYYAIP